MHFKKIIGVGAFVMCACGSASAAHPPLDRPTPPPCCADGICYPNPLTYGWYQTRWRRWPTEDLTPVPAAPAPLDKLGPDIQPYQTPTPEHEDQRAPPPTKTPAEEAEEALDAPPSAPLTPPSGGERSGTEAAPAATPPTTPLVPPTSPLAPPTKMPWENGDEPTGDWDPPPALPKAMSVTIDRTPLRPTTNRLKQPQRTTTRRRTAPSHDPPPSLPVTLASADY